MFNLVKINKKTFYNLSSALIPQDWIFPHKDPFFYSSH